MIRKAEGGILLLENKTGRKRLIEVNADAGREEKLIDTYIPR